MVNVIDNCSEETVQKPKTVPNDELGFYEENLKVESIESVIAQTYYMSKLDFVIDAAKSVADEYANRYVVYPLYDSKVDNILDMLYLDYGNAKMPDKHRRKCVYFTNFGNSEATNCEDTPFMRSLELLRDMIRATKYSFDGNNCYFRWKEILLHVRDFRDRSKFLKLENTAAKIKTTKLYDNFRDCVTAINAISLSKTKSVDSNYHTNFRSHMLVDCALQEVEYYTNLKGLSSQIKEARSGANVLDMLVRNQELDNALITLYKNITNWFAYIEINRHYSD